MGGHNINRIIVSATAIGLLVGCAGSPLGSNVQRSLEPDPQLEDAPESGNTDGSANDSDTAADLEKTDTVAPASPIEPREGEPTTPPESDVSRDLSATQGAGGARSAVAEPGEPDFIGPVWNPEIVSSQLETELPAEDLAGVPPELQDYVQELWALQVLELSRPPDNSEKSPAEGGTAAGAFNQAITRREYAQWLFETNNRFYDGSAGKRIRAATVADQPAFKDVPPEAADFAAIQGLADAGIIPSALTGNSTAVTFRPDAPVTREDLILWKVPLDTRAALPQTSPEAVTETWGFQDTASIEPLALRAIAADFQLGDFANIRRAFGYTTLLRPDKAVTRAEAAAVLWRFGTQTDGITAVDVLAAAEAAADGAASNQEETVTGPREEEN